MFIEIHTVLLVLTKTNLYCIFVWSVAQTTCPTGQNVLQWTMLRANQLSLDSSRHIH